KCFAPRRIPQRPCAASQGSCHNFGGLGWIWSLGENSVALAAIARSGGGGRSCAILRALVLQPSKSLSSLYSTASGTQLERSLLPGRRFHIRARRESQTSINLANAGRSHPHDRSRSTFPFNYGDRLRRCIGTNGFR